ncbi:TPA: hypothetical protein ACGO3A_000264 [Streptococcus suis]
MWNSTTSWVGQQWNNYQSRTSYRATPAGGYGGGSSQGSSSYYYTQQHQAQQRAQAEQRRQQAIRNEYAQATGIKGTPSREGKNIFRNWGKALAKTLKHVCTTAERVGKQIVKAAKKINWKKVAIVAVATVAAVAVTVATAGAAGPIIAAGVSGLGLSGAAATVVTAAAVGVVSGAAGGAVSGFTTGVLSGDKPKDVLAKTWNGAVNGFVSGGLTGGLVGGVSTATSSVTGPAARYAVDTLGETMADTIADAAQGGKVTPSSIATSLVFNTVSDGVSARGVKGAKADVPKNKPKAGDVSIRKSPKDTTPVQQLALPGPKSKPLALPAPEPILALPAPKSTPKTDFYVNPDGTTYTPSQYSPRVVEDLTKGLAVSTGRNSRWNNIDSSGGYKQAVSDFASLDLTNIKRITTPKYGHGLTGQLPDGTSVSIRRGSGTGPATMDIGLKDGRYKGTKIRFWE